MQIGAYASRPHYRLAIAPIVDELQKMGVDARWVEANDRDKVKLLLVGGYSDGQSHSRVILAEHGAGQTYRELNPALVGGPMRDHVVLSLVPRPDLEGAEPQARWCGPVMLDEAHPIGGRVGTFHWTPATGTVEQTGLWRDYLPAMIRLQDERVLDGVTVHPRDWPAAAQHFGLTTLPAMACAAEVIIADNTSAAWWSAARGGRVIWLHHPSWRWGGDLRFDRVLLDRLGHAVISPSRLGDVKLIRDLCDVEQPPFPDDVFGPLDGKSAMRAARLIADLL